MTGQEAFDRVMARIAKLETSSGISFLDALDASIECLFLKLQERRSDLVQAKFDMDTEITAFSLPAAYRGMVEEPYLVSTEDSVITLLPLPINGDASLEGETGEPKYYEVIGRTMYLSPTGEEAYALKGKYYSRPTVVTMATELPWNGVLDHIICEAVIEATRVGGLMGLMANQSFLTTLTQALNAILPNRSSRPRRVQADT